MISYNIEEYVNRVVNSGWIQIVSPNSEKRTIECINRLRKENPGTKFRVLEVTEKVLNI